ncbi:MAG: hypothetical protein RIC35_23265 [Marinoscillum sp.]
MKTAILSTRWLLLSSAICFVLTSQAQSKITLKEYDDPSLSGYKTIVFEYEEVTPGQPGQPAQNRKVTKEFDIEANNPFLKMGFEMINPGSENKTLRFDKSSVERLRSQFKENIKNGNGTLMHEAELGATHTFVREEENHVILSYNLFLYDANGEHIDNGGRFSAIHILDKKGNLVKKIDNIPTDAYGTAVSENGKYLAYGFGETLHGTMPGSIESGFRIVDLDAQRTCFELDAGYVEGISSLYDMLVIAYINEKGKQRVVLDALDGGIYGPAEFMQILNHFMFRQSGGKVIGLEDLKRIK